MRVRLVKKFAEMIDGIDLRGRQVGELLDVSPAEAQLLRLVDEALELLIRESRHGAEAHTSELLSA